MENSYAYALEGVRVMYVFLAICNNLSILPYLTQWNAKISHYVAFQKLSCRTLVLGGEEVHVKAYRCVQGVEKLKFSLSSVFILDILL